MTHKYCTHLAIYKNQVIYFSGTTEGNGGAELSLELSNSQKRAKATSLESATAISKVLYLLPYSTT